MNETPFEKAVQEAAAFQKLCLENMTKAFEAFKFNPEAPPPEILRQVRSGILQALGQSWDEFMRSPQFLECLRQWMDNAVALRTSTNEFLGRIRNEAQAPSRSDIDTVLLAVRHMEKRLLDRLDELSAQVSKANGRTHPAARPANGDKRARAKAAGRRVKAAKATATGK